MKIVRSVSLVVSTFCLTGFLVAQAATFEEDFTTNPAARGWHAVGDPSLFHWDETAQNLAVTWDSRRPNSYFCRSLHTVLSKEDDFSLAFDLRLSDLVLGINPDKPYTFQLAVGFINLATATAPNYFRATGMDSPNLVEFDYFPDSGFGATVSPTIISTNMQFASSFNVPFELTPDDLFHVRLTYTATNHTLVTVMTRNGAAFGPIGDVTLAGDFTDVRLDHVAISSYSDAGQDPQYDGSVLAHGVVDNLVVEVPAPAVRELAGRVVDGHWQAEFVGRDGWSCTLEASADLQTWAAVAPAVVGTGVRQVVSDPRPLAGKSFYRLRAERP